MLRKQDVEPLIGKTVMVIFPCGAGDDSIRGELTWVESDPPYKIAAIVTPERTITLRLGIMRLVGRVFLPNAFIPLSDIHALNKALGPV
jgi:hypothetical protein